MKPLLTVNALSTIFSERHADGDTTTIEANHNVSFDLEQGKTLAIVGESGSGKSVVAHSILRLLPYPKASHPTGSIEFDGQAILALDDSRLRAVRSSDISMIFQEFHS